MANAGQSSIEEMPTQEASINTDGNTQAGERMELAEVMSDIEPANQTEELGATAMPSTSGVKPKAVPKEAPKQPEADPIPSTSGAKPKTTATEARNMPEAYPGPSTSKQPSKSKSKKVIDSAAIAEALALIVKAVTGSQKKARAARLEPAKPRARGKSSDSAKSGRSDGKARAKRDSSSEKAKKNQPKQKKKPSPLGISSDEQDSP